ncbi:MAG: undecaprenyl-phosphate glucose phosphotransferase [Provencibacterium sp.]|jgi:Undecaprenyl-phosphate glucose phosphotransferase|nr:undecaprenyl-phosphate glucose phosphotransferase [Provencibacterium sp.]
MIKENQRALNTLLLIADGGCILGSLPAAYWIRFSLFSSHPDHLPFQSYLWLLPFVLCAHIFFGYLLGLYRSKRSNPFRWEVRLLLRIDLALLLLVLMALYLLHQEYYSRLCLFFWFVLIPASMCAERSAVRLTLRALRKKGYNLKYILLIGNGELAASFAAKVKRNPQFGFRFGGCLCNGIQDASSFQGIPILGDYGALSGLLDQGGIDEVVAALELNEYPSLQQIICLCEKHGAKINIVPAYFKYLPARPYWDEFDGLPVMTLRKIPLSNPWNAAVKRLFDIAVSLLALGLSSPVMAAVALVIRLSMREPPIYRQERIGFNCKPFVMYKFRSMRTADTVNPGWTGKHDPRRTPFGAWIRRFSIDELPQFYNVLKGDMSVVGPRPEIRCYVEQFRESIPRYMVKHQVKPGITGLAQIRGLRGDTSIEERVRQDLYYIENWSVWMDIYIVLKTVTKAFYNQNE